LLGTLKVACVAFNRAEGKVNASSQTVRKEDEYPARPTQLRPQAVAAVAAIAGTPAIGALRVPSLRVMPLQPVNPVRRFARVPTHAVGVFPEQREYPRASLRLPLRLRSVDGRAEDFPITLVTRDISSTGVFFLCPKRLDANTPIELEIVLVSKPMGEGNVVVVTKARVKRIESAAMPGWFGIAASYDDVQFDRDDGIPGRISIV